jgi:DNA-binding transcriptional ArsR family regulator
MQAYPRRSVSEKTDEAQGTLSRWLSVNQIRKMQRMRRTTVVAAMEAGELPFERRGRIRFARLSDVLIWEERRLSREVALSTRSIRPDLVDFA